MLKRILISGGTGFIGSEVVSYFQAASWEVSILGRSESSDVVWDPYSGKILKGQLENFDAIIHLAGENIGKGFKWTEEKKQKIYRSRIESTKNLTRIIERLTHPPKILIVASAIGYYGDREDEMLNEFSSPGIGFLSEVCQAWEKASHVDPSRGVRVVNTRFGMVLSPKGGALKEMLPLFKWGLGACIGPGKQWISWIALDDLVGAMAHVISREDLEGPVNFVSPKPQRNKDFSKLLAKTVRRWLFPPIPSFIIRLFLGEKGKALLLSSARVKPKRLVETGYKFIYPSLDIFFNNLG